MVDRPGEDPQGHFGLAVKDYAHSTAPNRRFPDLVTGASPKGTFVRLFTPAVEGMLAHGVIPGIDVGDRLRVRLDRVDVDRGFIDLSRA